MPAPLPQTTRDAVADDIRAGCLGRNAIARKHGISAGVVTKIARANEFWFPNDWQTMAGARARQIDLEAARLEREDELLNELLSLPQTTRQRDGRETKAYRRLSYKLYDLQRHHR